MDTQQLAEQGAKRAADYWRGLGAVTVGEAVAMPWGGDRNLALRKALHLAFPGDAVVLMHRDDTIQVAHPKRARAEAVGHMLEADLPGWTVLVSRRPDRQWLVVAVPPGVEVRSW